MQGVHMQNYYLERIQKNINQIKKSKNVVDSNKNEQDVPSAVYEFMNESPETSRNQIHVGGTHCVGSPKSKYNDSSGFVPNLKKENVVPHGIIYSSSPLRRAYSNTGDSSVNQNLNIRTMDNGSFVEPLSYYKNVIQGDPLTYHKSPVLLQSDKHYSAQEVSEFHIQNGLAYEHSIGGFTQAVQSNVPMHKSSVSNTCSQSYGVDPIRNSDLRNDFVMNNGSLDDGTRIYTSYINDKSIAQMNLTSSGISEKDLSVTSSPEEKYSLYIKRLHSEQIHNHNSHVNQHRNMNRLISIDPMLPRNLYEEDSIHSKGNYSTPIYSNNSSTVHKPSGERKTTLHSMYVQKGISSKQFVGTPREICAVESNGMVRSKSVSSLEQLQSEHWMQPHTFSKHNLTVNLPKSYPKMGMTPQINSHYETLGTNCDTRNSKLAGETSPITTSSNNMFLSVPPQNFNIPKNVSCMNGMTVEASPRNDPNNIEDTCLYTKDPYVSPMQHNQLKKEAEVIYKFQNCFNQYSNKNESSVPLPEENLPQVEETRKRSALSSGLTSEEIMRIQNNLILENKMKKEKEQVDITIKKFEENPVFLNNSPVSPKVRILEEVQKKPCTIEEKVPAEMKSTYQTEVAPETPKQKQDPHVSNKALLPEEMISIVKLEENMDSQLERINTCVNMKETLDEKNQNTQLKRAYQKELMYHQTEPISVREEQRNYSMNEETKIAFKRSSSETHITQRSYEWDEHKSILTKDIKKNQMNEQGAIDNAVEAYFKKEGYIKPKLSIYNEDDDGSSNSCAYPNNLKRALWKNKMEIRKKMKSSRIGSLMTEEEKRSSIENNSDRKKYDTFFYDADSEKLICKKEGIDKDVPTELDPISHSKEDINKTSEGMNHVNYEGSRELQPIILDKEQVISELIQQKNNLLFGNLLKITKGPNVVYDNRENWIDKNYQSIIQNLNEQEKKHIDNLINCLDPSYVDSCTDENIRWKHKLQFLQEKLLECTLCVCYPTQIWNERYFDAYLRSLNFNALLDDTLIKYDGNLTIDLFKKDEEIFSDIGSVGEGGFGVVTKMRFLNGCKYYAIKKIAKSQIIKSQAAGQAYLEAKCHSILSHVNIIKMYGCMQDDEYIYHILEYCSKGSIYALSKNFKKRIFPDEIAYKYFCHVVNGLYYLNQMGIFHRDIKMENILVDHMDNAKLSDFGLTATILGPNSHSALCGTLVYFSPEIASGNGYDWRSDIWSLGVLLYEMLFGDVPFDGSKANILESIFLCNPQFPKFVNPLARNLIKKLLVVDPNKRIKLCDLAQDPWMQQMWKQTFEKNLNKENSYDKRLNPSFGPVTAKDLNSSYNDMYDSNWSGSESEYSDRNFSKKERGDGMFHFINTLLQKECLIKKSLNASLNYIIKSKKFSSQSILRDMENSQEKEGAGEETEDINSIILDAQNRLCEYLGLEPDAIMDDFCENNLDSSIKSESTLILASHSFELGELQVSSESEPLDLSKSSSSYEQEIKREIVQNDLEATSSFNDSHKKEQTNTDLMKEEKEEMLYETKNDVPVMVHVSENEKVSNEVPPCTTPNESSNNSIEQTSEESVKRISSFSNIEEGSEVDEPFIPINVMKNQDHCEAKSEDNSSLTKIQLDLHDPSEERNKNSTHFSDEPGMNSATGDESNKNEMNVSLEETSVGSVYDKYISKINSLYENIKNKKLVPDLIPPFSTNAEVNSDKENSDIIKEGPSSSISEQISVSNSKSNTQRTLSDLKPQITEDQHTFMKPRMTPDFIKPNKHIFNSSNENSLHNSSVRSSGSDNRLSSYTYIGNATNSFKNGSFTNESEIPSGSAEYNYSSKEEVSMLNGNEIAVGNSSEKGIKASTMDLKQMQEVPLDKTCFDNKVTFMATIQKEESVTERESQYTKKENDKKQMTLGKKIPSKSTFQNQSLRTKTRVIPSREKVKELQEKMQSLNERVRSFNERTKSSINEKSTTRTGVTGKLPLKNNLKVLPKNTVPVEKNKKILDNNKGRLYHRSESRGMETRNRMEENKLPRSNGYSSPSNKTNALKKDSGKNGFSFAKKTQETKNLKKKMETNYVYTSSEERAEWIALLEQAETGQFELREERMSSLENDDEDEEDWEIDQTQIETCNIHFASESSVPTEGPMLNIRFENRLKERKPISENKMSSYIEKEEPKYNEIIYTREEEEEEEEEGYTHEETKDMKHFHMEDNTKEIDGTTEKEEEVVTKNSNGSDIEELENKENRNSLIKDMIRDNNNYINKNKNILFETDLKNSKVKEYLRNKIEQLKQKNNNLKSILENEKSDIKYSCTSGLLSNYSYMNNTKQNLLDSRISRIRTKPDEKRSVSACILATPRNNSKLITNKIINTSRTYNSNRSMGILKNKESTTISEVEHAKGKSSFRCKSENTKLCTLPGIKKSSTSVHCNTLQGKVQGALKVDGNNHNSKEDKLKRKDCFIVELSHHLDSEIKSEKDIVSLDKEELNQVQMKEREKTNLASGSKNNKNNMYNRMDGVVKKSTTSKSRTLKSNIQCANKVSHRKLNLSSVKSRINTNINKKLKGELENSLSESRTKENEPTTSGLTKKTKNIKNSYEHQKIANGKLEEIKDHSNRLTVNTKLHKTSDLSMNSGIVRMRDLQSTKSVPLSPSVKKSTFDKNLKTKKSKINESEKGEKIDSSKHVKSFYLAIEEQKKYEEELQNKLLILNKKKIKGIEKNVMKDLNDKKLINRKSTVKNSTNNNTTNYETYEINPIEQNEYICNTPELNREYYLSEPMENMNYHDTSTNYITDTHQQSDLVRQMDPHGNSIQRIVEPVKQSLYPNEMRNNTCQNYLNHSELLTQYPRKAVKKSNSYHPTGTITTEAEKVTKETLRNHKTMLNYSNRLMQGKNNRTHPVDVQQRKITSIDTLNITPEQNRIPGNTDRSYQTKVNYLTNTSNELNRKVNFARHPSAKIDRRFNSGLLSPSRKSNNEVMKNFSVDFYKSQLEKNDKEYQGKETNDPYKMRTCDVKDMSSKAPLMKRSVTMVKYEHPGVTLKMNPFNLQVPIHKWTTANTESARNTQNTSKGSETINKITRPLRILHKGGESPSMKEKGKAITIEPLNYYRPNQTKTQGNENREGSAIVNIPGYTLPHSPVKTNQSKKINTYNLYANHRYT